MDWPVLGKRSRERESMDDAHAPLQVIQAEYRFLEPFNRLLNAAPALMAAIEQRVVPLDGSITVVDCGTGGADIPRHLMKLAERKPWSCKCICTDVNERAVEFARARTAACSSDVSHGLDFRVADIRHLPAVLGAKSADVTHASLVMHHLDDAAVVEALRSMATVARQLVVWNDLVRDREGVIGARISTMFARPELRRDAVVSVQRSFTLEEARSVAEAAGLQDIRVGRVRGARFLLTARPGGSEVQAGRPMARAHDVNGVAFVVHSGQAVLVSGADERAKSALLACMVGARAPHSGCAWIDRSHAKPGYLPAGGGVLSRLSVQENCALAARLAGVHAAHRDAKVRAALERFGVSELARRRIGTLTGDERQRACLACTLVHEPNVLVLDHADAKLGALGLAALEGAVRSVLDAGGIMLAAAHDPEWVRRAAGQQRMLEVAL